MRTLTIADPALVGSVRKSLLQEVMADGPQTLWIGNDGSGAPQDSSGNSRHLTLANGSNTYASDGTYGTVLDMSSGSWTTTFRCPQSAYTLEAWIRLSTNVSGDACPIGDWGGNNTFGAMMLLTPSSNALLAYHRESTISGGNLSTGTWYHLAQTWNGSTVRLYLNGSEVGTPISTSTAPGTANESGLSRVSSYGGVATGRRVPGQGRFIAWYSSALSGSRIAAHRAAGV